MPKVNYQQEENNSLEATLIQAPLTTHKPLAQTTPSKHRQPPPRTTSLRQLNRATSANIPKILAVSHDIEPERAGVPSIVDRALVDVDGRGGDVAAADGRDVVLGADVNEAEDGAGRRQARDGVVGVRDAVVATALVGDEGREGGVADARGTEGVLAGNRERQQVCLCEGVRGE